MVSTFINPVVNSSISLGNPAFGETDPVQLWPSDSVDAIEVVIRAVYRQVLGNAYVMESERLTVPESQLKQGMLTVREFVRQVAKSDLYRSRFADNCYRYRAIELNFKHLLGRAPQSFAEMKAHSAILDAEGYDADIDSYIDSEEYDRAFGENTVPYYRGYNTVPGQTMLEFTNMLQLLKSNSSSDKDLVDNTPRLTRAIIRNAPNGIDKPRDGSDIAASVLLRPKTQTAKPKVYIAPPVPASQTQAAEQDALIEKLREQLAQLRPFATIGTAITRKGSQLTAATVEPGSTTLQKKDDKAALIERLQGELMEARALASIGEARLNKWRR